jgi:hypothetical protein
VSSTTFVLASIAATAIFVFVAALLYPTIRARIRSPWLANVATAAIAFFPLYVAPLLYIARAARERQEYIRAHQSPQQRAPSGVRLELVNATLTDDGKRAAIEMRLRVNVWQDRIRSFDLMVTDVDHGKGYSLNSAESANNLEAIRVESGEFVFIDRRRHCNLRSSRDVVTIPIVAVRNDPAAASPSVVEVEIYDQEPNAPHSEEKIELKFPWAHI